MTTEEHLWAAMANIQHDMGSPEAAPLNDKLMQVMFGVRRWERERDKVRLAVVNHHRDRLAGIHVVEDDGGNAA